MARKISTTIHSGNGEKNRAGQSGQVAVEYVLLLVVGVVVWMLLVNGLVRRDPNSPGVFTGKWRQIIQWIGSDSIEK